jgi:phage gpG-like protein
MERVAAAGHSIILGRIKSGIKPANAPLTREVKQGDHTLMDNGQLIASLRWKADKDTAQVSSNHIAALVNNPPDDREFYEITPKKAKSLAIPASARTRTMMRRFGFTPRECIEGMKRAGYTIWQPKKKGSTVRAGVIMAMENGEKSVLKSGQRSGAKRYQAFALFILAKKVRVPVRRFMYLTEKEIDLIDEIIGDYIGNENGA